MTVPPKRHLVRSAAAAMRDLILSREPDTQIGSLPELAKLLGVGIVTVQQAARVLEHEGLLEVRRGPGGGYYGVRPDAFAVQRSVAAYLRVRGTDNYEALEMMTLVDCELMPAAARCSDEDLHRKLSHLEAKIDGCSSGSDRLAFEDELHDTLFAMVERPLMELLARVSMHYYRDGSIPMIFDGVTGVEAWRRWRRDVISAILRKDPELAQFQARRHRKLLLKKLEHEGLKIVDAASRLTMAAPTSLSSGTNDPTAIDI